jgi:hypothetical protein
VLQACAVWHIVLKSKDQPGQSGQGLNFIHFADADGDQGKCHIKLEV